MTRVRSFSCYWRIVGLKAGVSPSQSTVLHPPRSSAEPTTNHAAAGEFPKRLRRFNKPFRPRNTPAGRVGTDFRLPQKSSNSRSHHGRPPLFLEIDLECAVDRFADDRELAALNRRRCTSRQTTGIRMTRPAAVIPPGDRWSQVRNRLAAGGKRIRTIGPA